MSGQHFQVVDRPEPNSRHRNKELYESIEDTARTGKAVMVPLNGRQSLSVRSNLSAAMKKRGVRIVSTVKDQSLFVWAVDLNDRGSDD